MNLTTIREASACVDEALHVYRTSTTAWETASAYYRPSESPHPQLNEVSDPGIRYHSSQPLPPTFISQYSNVRFKSFMGLFPQINRAWLTVDSNLFLWAYNPLGNSTSSSTDLFVYEGCSQIIVSVALIKPRPGYFVESLQYLIAVATTVEVILLGVVFSSTGQLSIQETNISIPTDNAIMLKILSSDDGRIFMAGADGGLHQFVYSPNHSASLFDLFSARPRKRAKKVAHSTSLASYLLPTAVKSWFNSQNELVDLAIEGTSLFTLSQAGMLSVYDISNDQVKLISTSNISSDAKHLFNFSISPSDREFVSIHPVAASASSSVQLIVVTSLGERIYYSTRTSTVTSPLQPPARPTSLRCIAYRPSPDADISRSSHPCVHISWCHRGAAIFADLKDRQSDRLICVYPDVNIQSSQGGRGDGASMNSARTGEIVLTTSLEDTPDTSNYMMQARTPRTPMTQQDFGVASTAPNHTFAIAEAEFPQHSDSSSSAINAPMDPPYFFWVLTSSAIHLYERVNAMDRLREILSKYCGNNEAVRKFFNRYGVADSCAMCLEIAIMDPPLARVAANVFYTAGGAVAWNRTMPSPSSNTTVRRRGGYDPENSFVFQNRFDVGRAAVEAAPMARFSGTHDGITLYLAKVLHPIWNNYITTDRNIDAYQELFDSQETLISVRDQLMAVSLFLQRYSPDELLPQVRNEEDDRDINRPDGGPLNARDRRSHLGTGDDNFAGISDDDAPMSDRVVHGLYELKRTDEARRLESNAIKGLIKLAQRASEALALMLIVYDHQIHRLAMCMSNVGRRKLINARWHDLIADEDGNIVASSLIEAMFTLYEDVGVAMSSVGKLLQERCSSFFGNIDEDLHRGLSLLKQAVMIYSESTGGSNGAADGMQPGWLASMNKADEAVIVLKRVAGNIFDMRAVFDDFKRIKAIAGLVDIALAIGAEAEESRRDGRAEEAFTEVLNVVKDLIGDRQDHGMYDDLDESMKEASLRLALNCKSDHFLQQLYTMLRGSRRGQEMLLKEWSGNVENFLLENEALETLWKYYAQHGRHFEAATVLLKLAETGTIGLVDRLNYLSCALLNAKTATSKGDERASGLLVELTDFLDVAKVQVRIRDELAAGAGQRQLPQVNHPSVSGDGDIDGSNTLGDDENDTGRLNRPPQAARRGDENGRRRAVERDALKEREEEIKRAVESLDEEIMSLSTLFNRYARHFDLHECCLECLRCGSYRDDKYVRQVWKDIVARESAKTDSRRLVGQNLEAIGRQFYPSEVVMPIGYVVEVLEMLNVHAYDGEDVEWGLGVLRGIGVPLTDIVDGYRKLVEQGSGGSGGGGTHPQHNGFEYDDGTVGTGGGGTGWDRWWVEEQAQVHLLKVMERAMSLWMEELRVMDWSARRSVLHDGDKAARVVQVAKSRLRGMSGGVGGELWNKYERVEEFVGGLS